MKNKNWNYLWLFLAVAIFIGFVISFWFWPTRINFAFFFLVLFAIGACIYQWGVNSTKRILESSKTWVSINPDERKKRFSGIENELDKIIQEQEKKTIWIRLYYSLFFTITSIAFFTPPFLIVRPHITGVFREIIWNISNFFNLPFYHSLAILMSLLFIAIGFTIFLLRRWSRLIALAIGLLFVLSSIRYLLPRPGMSTVFTFKCLEYKIMVALWSIMALCSTLILFIERNKVFRRIALAGAIFFF